MLMRVLSSVMLLAGVVVSLAAESEMEALQGIACVLAAVVMAIWTIDMKIFEERRR